MFKGCGVFLQNNLNKTNHYFGNKDVLFWYNDIGGDVKFFDLDKSISPSVKISNQDKILKFKKDNDKFRIILANNILSKSSCHNCLSDISSLADKKYGVVDKIREIDNPECLPYSDVDDALDVIDSLITEIEQCANGICDRGSYRQELQQELKNLNNELYIEA